MIFVDTNYFLHFLLADTSQHQEAKQLFLDAAEKKVKLFTSLIVVFEIYWVLTSFYTKGKNEVAKTLLEVLSLDFIEFPEREILKEAVETYRKTGFDLEDSFNLAYAVSRKASGIRTFDIRLEKEFKKLEDK